MPAKPYINIFIGDWIRDTRRLAPEVKGVLIDIKMECSLSVIAGVITLDITELEKLLCLCYNSVMPLLSELQQRELITVEQVEGKKLRITDLQIVNKSAKSRAKSEAGKKGMQNRWKKDNPPVITKPITPVITNDITNTGNDIDNSKEEGKGGAGEKEEGIPRTSYENISNISILSMADCLEVYLHADGCAMSREMLCHNMHFAITQDTSELQRLKDWGEAFNRVRIKANEVRRPFGQWCDHFYNWLSQQNLKSDPKNILSNVSNNPANRGYQSPIIRRGSNATATIPAGRDFDS